MLVCLCPLSWIQQDWSFSSMSVVKNNENFLFLLFWLEGWIMVIELLLITSEWFFFLILSSWSLYSEPVANLMTCGFVLKLTVVSSRVEKTLRGFIQIWVQLASQRKNLLPWLSGREGNKYAQQKNLAHTPLSKWSQCISHSFWMWDI